MMTLRTVALLWVVYVSVFVCMSMSAQTTTSFSGVQYQSVMLKFIAQKKAVEPIRDVRVVCEYTHTTGITFMAECFWNGGQEYASRFLPMRSGVWTYRTIAQDTTDRGLHNQQGTLTIEPAQSQHPNPLYRNGNLGIADNPRFFAHENGEPFFWLADTAWEIVWKSRLAEMKSYISDRKRKGFTALQIVCMSHQVFTRGVGVINRNNEPYFLDNNYLRLNPRYFQYLDTLVQMANDSGMVAVLVPLWAYMNELHPSIWVSNQLNREQSLNAARYIGARYAGNHVAWIMAGDNSYTTPAQKEFWNTFARTIHQSSGRRHISTIHPLAWSASFDYFPQTTDWLDFNMYQSSHVAEERYTWEAGMRGAALTPTKPNLNGEAVYEDIFNNLWEPGDTVFRNTFRIRPEHVRRASYESMFSGAQAGITYGGNGIWQWNTREIPGSHQPRFTVDSAWNFIGSTQMAYLKSFMVALPWYRMSPYTQVQYRNGRVPGDPQARVWSMIRNDNELLVCYVPKPEPIRVDFPSIKATFVTVQWWSPSTNQWSIADTLINRNFLTIQPPRLPNSKVPNTVLVNPDIMLVVRALEYSSPIVPITPSVEIDGIAPNPIVGEEMVLRYAMKKDHSSALHISIVNMQGKEVYSSEAMPNLREFRWNLRDVQGNRVTDGAYIARLYYASTVRSIPFVIVR